MLVFETQRRSVVPWVRRCECCTVTFSRVVSESDTAETCPHAVRLSLTQQTGSHRL